MPLAALGVLRLRPYRCDNGRRRLASARAVARAPAVPMRAFANLTKGNPGAVAAAVRRVAAGPGSSIKLRPVGPQAGPGVREVRTR
jgi:hypothetical protein